MGGFIFAFDRWPRFALLWEILNASLKPFLFFILKQSNSDFEHFVQKAGGYVCVPSTPPSTPIAFLLFFFIFFIIIFKL